MALCKSPRQPSHALMITGGASGVVLPRRSCALLFFFPSNYPWGGFFLTLVLGKEKKNPPRNHFPIMNTHSSARPARRKTEKKKRERGGCDVSLRGSSSSLDATRRLPTAFCSDQKSIWLHHAPWLCLAFKGST